MTPPTMIHHATFPAAMSAAVNPFATRYTRPGAVPPLDAGGRPLDVEALLDRVAPGCSVVEGPHGHGKTTLVRSLLAEAAAAGRPTCLVPVRSWTDAWPALRAVATVDPGGLVAVDGWERLPRPCRMALAILSRWRRLAVVATAHSRVGLPVLAVCTSSPALVEAIVARLPDHGGTISPVDVAEAYRRQLGNVRDTLATLYDRFEERRT